MREGQPGSFVLWVYPQDGDDVYTTSLAAAALGPDADGRAFKAVIQRGRDEVANGIAGPIYTSREILRADRNLHVLEAPDLDALRAAVSVRDLAGSSDVFEALYLQEIGRELDVAAEVDRWASSWTTDCAGDHDVPYVGAVVSVSALRTRCSALDIEPIFRRGFEEVDDRAEITLDLCETVLGLARIVVAVWPGDTALASDIGRASTEALDRLDASPNADVVPCASSLRQARDLLGLPTQLGGATRGILEDVVRSGGPPIETVLDLRGALLVGAASRILGSQVEVVPSAFDSLSLIDRLALELADPHGDGSRVEAMLSSALAQSTDAAGATLILRGADSLGEKACPIPGMLDFVDAIIDEPGNGRPDGSSWLTAALAVRVAERCGDVRALEARALVRTATSGTVKNLGSAGNAGLLETWEAVAATCAIGDRIEPVDASRLFDRFSDVLLEAGGAGLEPGEGFSALATFALVDLLRTAEMGCNA